MQLLRGNPGWRVTWRSRAEEEQRRRERRRDEAWIIDRFARARARRQTFPINAGKRPENVIAGVFFPPLLSLSFSFFFLSDSAGNRPNYGRRAWQGDEGGTLDS